MRGDVFVQRTSETPQSGLSDAENDVFLDCGLTLRSWTRTWGHVVNTLTGCSECADAGTWCPGTRGRDLSMLDVWMHVRTITSDLNVTVHPVYTTTTSGMTAQPRLPLQMLLQLPEEQPYSHGVPALCSSRLLVQPLRSH